MPHETFPTEKPAATPVTSSRCLTDGAPRGRRARQEQSPPVSGGRSRGRSRPTTPKAGCFPFAQATMPPDVHRTSYTLEPATVISSHFSPRQNAVRVTLQSLSWPLVALHILLTAHPE